MVNILIVDDNKKIRKLIKEYLKQESYNVFEASNGLEALKIIEHSTIDLMIVDIMMPEMDGYSLTEDLRISNYTFHILMVTAKETIEDKKKGFRLGTDDYMVKPIDLDEMVLRVGALLRRARISAEKKIQIGSVEINYEKLSVINENETIFLPKKELYLLFKLLSYPKKIFTRQQLMDDIWGLDSEADERTVDVHIKRLREKLKHIKGFEILTVRGLGYKAEKR
jgi:DNA-binding response OmpR family regulator